MRVCAFKCVCMHVLKRKNNDNYHEYIQQCMVYNDYFFSSELVICTSRQGVLRLS